MQHLLPHHRWPLLAMVAALAGVTATSVALAIAALIDNTLLAILFASAAVVLDLFKYIAWPLALGLLAARRTVCALLMMACALALGVVSGWATYDRLMSSIITSRAEQLARQEQRQADLVEQRAADAARIEKLDGEAVAIHLQANALRERGMVTRALELETAALARIDAERERAQVRRDQASQELTDLLARPAKAAGLPLELATLLCLGFAAALEIVPALILAALRPAPATEPAPVAVTAKQERHEERPQEQAETGRVTAAGDGIPTELLQLIASTERGTKVAVRQVARVLRIGSDRATKLMQKAAEAGLLSKTASGYVAA
ncbi:hypothetical protein L5T15_000953 [Pseudomonas aeruginosa]|uniref:hypothetical protein n=1 Tax=Pseudomonas aeruginosa TaxID=287 RepID=UPI001CEFC95C|nr:hypothetical protein [Pseudomonas aeruginosa]EIU1420721.1 hypothetical protein [Pseudomonas aeruginosa]EKU3791502.1 hypothetical protein [Pseudomonas aeruginosa]EKV3157768.1 hypothetical protein [Pseudomonas aeruginosa]EKX0258280.1 hypothetical protein [Pseudomonas aeruginosa]MDQ4185306.1 hypothetical protein [Pseudomonas aeruginosa]